MHDQKRQSHPPCHPSSCPCATEKVVLLKQSGRAWIQSPCLTMSTLCRLQVSVLSARATSVGLEHDHRHIQRTLRTLIKQHRSDWARRSRKLLNVMLPQELGFWTGSTHPMYPQPNCSTQLHSSESSHSPGIRKKRRSMKAPGFQVLNPVRIDIQPTRIANGI